MMLEQLWKQYRKSSKPRTRREVRRILLWRDSHSCQYCGISVRDRNWHADHQIAYSRGGKSHVGNLVVSCEKCNMEKSYKSRAVSFATPIEKRIWAWIMYLPYARLKDWM